MSDEILQVGESLSGEFVLLHERFEFGEYVFYSIDLIDVGKVQCQSIRIALCDVILTN
jgi:hypothetical protein